MARLADYKDHHEAHVRLLVCNRCRTVEEVPDYEGPSEEDALLMRVVDAHQACTPGGAVVGGETPEEAARQDRFLARVKRSDWNNEKHRPSILAQLGAAGDGEGLGSEFYAVKNTFQEDALKCFSKHNRPDKCIDWRDQSKVLGNALISGEEQQAASRLLEGLRQRSKPMQTYLCDFCPVKSKVQEKVFHQAGLYK